MKWTAIIPLNAGPLRKSRLSPVLRADQRLAVSEALSAHVLDCARACDRVEEIILLSPSAPDNGVGWRRDAGRGLNAELGDLRRDLLGRAVMIVHADLPFLRVADLDALADAAADAGCAIACDRHGLGTTALALAPGVTFPLAFGQNSFAAHMAAAPEGAVAIDRPGLGHDIDTMEDIVDALARGCLPDPAIAGLFTSLTGA